MGVRENIMINDGNEWRGWGIVKDDGFTKKCILIHGRTERPTNRLTLLPIEAPTQSLKGFYNF